MENHANNKTLGYTLIAIGVLMILFAVFNVYQVFTGKSVFFNLFSFNPIAIDLAKLIEGAPKNTTLTQELVSADLLNKPLNLVFHLLLMGFVASSGQKLASIGTMLVRTIKVNLKDESSKPTWK